MLSAIYRINKRHRHISTNTYALAELSSLNKFNFTAGNFVCNRGTPNSMQHQLTTIIIMMIIITIIITTITMPRPIVSRPRRRIQVCRARVPYIRFKLGWHNRLQVSRRSRVGLVWLLFQLVVLLLNPFLVSQPAMGFDDLDSRLNVAPGNYG